MITNISANNEFNLITYVSEADKIGATYQYVVLFL